MPFLALRVLKCGFGFRVSSCSWGLGLLISRLRVRDLGFAGAMMFRRYYNKLKLVSLACSALHEEAFSRV